MRKRKSQRGQVMLEFALVAPALFLVTFGAMDLSRVYRSAMVAAASSRAGVQYASSSVVAADDIDGITRAARMEAGSVAGMEVAVRHYCKCSLDGGEEPCTTTCSTRTRHLRVSSAVPYESVLKIPGLSSSLTLNSVSHLRIQ